MSSKETVSDEQSEKSKLGEPRLPHGWGPLDFIVPPDVVKARLRISSLSRPS